MITKVFISGRGRKEREPESGKERSEAEVKVM